MESSKVPMFIAVPKREPNAPKMFPLMPMAGGMSIISPAIMLNVSVIEPRVAPASRSPTEEIMSPTKPRVNTFRLREKNPRTVANEFIGLAIR
jgi:hypothetical protein